MKKKIKVTLLDVNYVNDNHPSIILNIEYKYLFGLITHKSEYWKFEDGWYEYDFGLIPLGKSKQNEIERTYQDGVLAVKNQLQNEKQKASKSQE